MNTFIRLIITCFVENRLSVKHDVAAKTVETLDHSYALNKFEHELGIAKRMTKHLSEKTIDEAIAEVKKFCDITIENSNNNTETDKAIQISDSLKQYIVKCLKEDGISVE